MKAYTKEGYEIVGTFEKVDAIGLGKLTKNPDGTASIKWEGKTEILWDTQKPHKEKGERVFIDGEGNTVTESQIVWRDE